MLVDREKAIAIIEKNALGMSWSESPFESGAGFELLKRAEALRALPVSDGLEDIATETLESMIAWGDETFGPCTQGRAISRAWEEWQEMLEKGADVPIEAADVIICLLRIPGILEAINRKMAINRKRTWDVRPDGSGYHVKAALGPLPAPPTIE